MAKRQEKIRIELVPVDDGRPAHEREKAVNDALVELARLIGRQIAREQFARRIALEREAAARVRAEVTQKDE